eukprot:scaffold9.g3216.t1
MPHLRQIFLAVLLAAVHCSSPGDSRPVCRASAYGACPSRSAHSTLALQAAIDACAAVNGTVLLDAPGPAPATYLSASLRLWGSVHLHIPAGVTLLAGAQRRDYGASQAEWYALYFLNCTSCSLSGGGTIDGQGRAFVEPQPWAAVRRAGRKALGNWADPSCSKPSECRPRLVGVVGSRHVAISGVRLVDPAYWALHVRRSSHVAITGVRIRGDWWLTNNDGIDIDGSSHVSVSAADIDTADDAICIKTMQRGAPARWVRVADCRLRSRSAAVKLGSETQADIEHVVFQRLDIAPSHRGLAIQLRDAGSIRNVTFAHIRLAARHTHPSWWGAGEAVSVTAVPRAAPLRGAAAPRQRHGTAGPGLLGQISGVVFHNVTATAENGIFIAGVAYKATDAASAWHSIQELVVTGMRLNLVRLSCWPGGCRDYRPSPRGLDCSSVGSASSTGGGWEPETGRGLAAATGRRGGGSTRGDLEGGARGSSGAQEEGGTAAVWVEGASAVVLQDVSVHYHTPPRPDWRQRLHIDTGSSANVRLERVTFRGGPAEHTPLA